MVNELATELTFEDLVALRQAQTQAQTISTGIVQPTMTNQDFLSKLDTIMARIVDITKNFDGLMKNARILATNPQDRQKLAQQLGMKLPKKVIKKVKVPIKETITKEKVVKTTESPEEIYDKILFALSKLEESNMGHMSVTELKDFISTNKKTVSKLIENHKDSKKEKKKKEDDKFSLSDARKKGE